MAEYKGEAFGTYKNPSRDPTQFSPLEDKARSLFSAGFKDRLLHEHLLKGQREGRKFHYWADYFEPFTQTCIEIDPKFHGTYGPVAKKDKRRDKDLRHLGVKTYRIKENRLTPNWVAYYERLITRRPIRSLDRFMNGHNGSE